MLWLLATLAAAMLKILRNKLSINMRVWKHTPAKAQLQNNPHKSMTSPTTRSCPRQCEIFYSCHLYRQLQPSMNINPVVERWDWVLLWKAACWMLNEGLNVFLFLWYVFIDPLVKGSNRYQDVRAGFCHDTSGFRHEKNTFIYLFF